MKKKIALLLSAVSIFTIVSTSPTIVNAQYIPDNIYSDEQGKFRVMVRITSDNAKIRKSLSPLSEVITTAKKGELYNYRGNLLGYYHICIRTELGEDKNNYCAYLSKLYGETVKLYNDGTIVDINN